MNTSKIITVGSKSYRPLHDENLTPEDIKKAQVELNETDSRREKALKEVKEKLKGDVSYEYRTDDDFIIAFLRTRKFNCEKTVKMIKNYAKFREEIPSFFPKPSMFEEELRTNIISFLPHRDHQGRAIHAAKIGLWNPDELSVYDLVGVSDTLTEYVLRNSVTQINGVIGIWDASGLSFKQFLQLSSPKLARAFTKMVQDRLPGRFKGVYIINCHKSCIALYNIFSYFLKEKFRHRIKFLSSDLTELHAIVDPAILPVEWGGVQPNLDCNDLVDKLLDKERRIQ
ncbi:clavesin-2-like [Uloborus diversus]|uniref:clavesin-2-like n=1 Tax=Uloborus diversus TaxID=327109 RepID=UPI00240A82B3|nr:clavesin-2-like [Uloborus diversus]